MYRHRYVYMGTYRWISRLNAKSAVVGGVRVKSGCCSNDRDTCEMPINLWRSFILRAVKLAGPSGGRSGGPSTVVGWRRQRGDAFPSTPQRQRRPTNRKPSDVSPATAYNTLNPLHPCIRDHDVIGSHYTTIILYCDDDDNINMLYRIMMIINNNM